MTTTCTKVPLPYKKRGVHLKILLHQNENHGMVKFVDQYLSYFDELIGKGYCIHPSWVCG